MKCIGLPERANQKLFKGKGMASIWASSEIQMLLSEYSSDMLLDQICFLNVALVRIRFPTGLTAMQISGR